MSFRMAARTGAGCTNSDSNTGRACITQAVIRAVVALDFPHSAIPAITAIRQLRREAGEDLSGEILFIANERARTPAAVEVLRRLVAPFPEVSLWIPTAEEDAQFFRRTRPLRARSRALRKRLGDGVTAVYFSHDLHLSFIPQSLLWAWPEAKRITFGDAMGVVYGFRYYRSITLGFAGRLYDDVRYLVARAVGFLPARLEPEVACLILPSDPGGDFLAGKRLVVPAVDDVLAVLGEMAKGWAEPLARVPREATHLLLLSNFSGGYLSTPEAEIALYREILEKHVPAGTTVLLKPHPASRAELIDALVASVSDRWKVLVLDPSMVTMPVELARDLVTRCTVLSLSFTTVSLPYLYGSRVIHALDDALIAKHVFPAKQRWVKDGNDVYLRMAAKLATWDRKSPL